MSGAVVAPSLPHVKIRIGYGLGTRTFTNDPSRFDPFVDALEDLGFDSLWLSERIGADCPDPVVGLAYAAGRTRRLKLGMSVMVLPGRNPALVAKELAGLDRLSGGRLLPAFGLGIADRHEQMAFGVERSERAAIFDESLEIIRRIWSGERVDHEGPHFTFSDLRVGPPPTDGALDVWLGGAAASELRRVGRLGDGWLPSFCTPEQARRGWERIEITAAEHGRSIDPEHFGALIPYTLGPDGNAELPPPVRRLLERRAPGVDPFDVVAAGWEGLARRISEFTAVGASKFVPVPIGEPEDWERELAEVARTVLPLQT